MGKSRLNHKNIFKLNIINVLLAETPAALESATLDLSEKHLKKLPKPTPDESLAATLILDDNELQRLEGIDSFSKVQKVSRLRSWFVYRPNLKRFAFVFAPFCFSVDRRAQSTAAYVRYLPVAQLAHVEFRA